MTTALVVLVLAAMVVLFVRTNLPKKKDPTNRYPHVPSGGGVPTDDGQHKPDDQLAS